MDYISLYLFLLLASAVIFFKLNYRYTLIAAPLYFWTLWNFSFPNSARDDAMNIALQTDQAILAVTIIVSIFWVNSKIKTDKIELFLAALGKFNIICAVIFLFGRNYYSGLIPNRSMNAILMCMLLPFLDSLFYGILTILFIIYFKSVTSYICLLFMLAYFFYTNRQIKKWWYLLTIPVVLAIAISQKTDGGRFEYWKFFFEGFTAIDFIIGKGPASFFTDSIYRQQFYKGANELYFMYLHNDYLQIIYEYGVIGLVSFFLFAKSVLRRATPQVGYSLMAFLGGMTLYYPLHFPIHLLVLFLVLRLAL